MEVMRVLAALNRVWVALEPERWTQCPWGDKTGGFWAVAVRGNRVLWFNEIEEGFNVSRFVTWGVIPNDEYWCTQDTLCTALGILSSGG